MDHTSTQFYRFAAYPEDEREVFYRLPYRFLNKPEDRFQDARQDIRPVLDAMELPQEVSAGDNTSHFKLGHGLYVAIEPNRTDLWIKTCLEESDTGQDAIDARQSIDEAIQRLPRTVYKYSRRYGELFAHVLRNKEWKSDPVGYLGLDAGSISINTAVVDEKGTVLEVDYTFTEGDVINNVKKSLANVYEKLPRNLRIEGTGVTGSGHEIAGALMIADVYETELDAHAQSAVHMVPEVKVVFDIGGQDSKVMYIEGGRLDEAGMNKKCGAGTGSFLNAQAARLGIPIERFGEVSQQAKKPYRFSSMCTVFVGRDLIAEQAKGNTKENIIAGLHSSLAMNFFSTLGINKKKLPTPIVFQGGVASNEGVRKALEECIEEARGKHVELIIPMFSNVMGAVGIALFALNETDGKTKFRGFADIARIRSEFLECSRAGALQCSSGRFCDLVHLFIDDRLVNTLYGCDDYNHRSEEHAWSESQDVPSYGKNEIGMEV